MADVEGRGKLTDNIGDTFAYNTRGEAEIKIRLGEYKKQNVNYCNNPFTLTSIIDF